jgi:hypothetical protein
VVEWSRQGGWRCIGAIPREVVEQLWPGFESPDLNVWVNGSHLRRHMQSRAAFMDRVALLNAIEPEMDALLGRAVAYLSFEKVPTGQAGIDVVCRYARDADEFVVVGVRLVGDRFRQRNFVATVFGWSAWEHRRSLTRRAHVLA